MSIIIDNDPGRAALQRELPDWTLDDRTVTWLWMVLRDMDREQRLGLHGLGVGEFGTKAMYVDMADAVRRLRPASSLRDDKTKYFLQRQDLQQIEKGGRQVNWLLHQFQDFLHRNKSPAPQCPAHLNQRDKVIALIDFWPASIEEKQRLLERLRRDWISHLDADAYYSWFKSSDQKKRCEAAWDWYREKHFGLVRNASKFTKLDDLLLCLDTSDLTLDERRFHIGEIKREVKRRQSRKNLEGKAQTNLALSEESRRQLNHLVTQQRVTMVAVVERLIQHAYKYGMPDETNADQQTTLF